MKCLRLLTKTLKIGIFLSKRKNKIKKIYQSPMVIMEEIVADIMVKIIVFNY